MRVVLTLAATLAAALPSQAWAEADWAYVKLLARIRRSNVAQADV